MYYDYAGIKAVNIININFVDREEETLREVRWDWSCGQEEKRWTVKCSSWQRGQDGRHEITVEEVSMDKKIITYSKIRR